MKKLYLIGVIINFFFWVKPSDAQTLELGILTSFEAFTGAGAVSNAGILIAGDVGTNNGLITGFALPAYLDSAYNKDSITDRCRYDLFRVYIHLNDLFVTYPSTHSPTFGSSETISPGVYSSIGAGSIIGSLTLDGKGDPNAYFVIKSNGAMTIGAGATVTLTNGAKACNVFYISEGAISVAANADIKGTLFAHIGAVSLGTGVTLEGRMFSIEGAISIGTGTEATKPLGISTIPIFCETDCTPSPAVDILGVLSSFALYTSFGAVANTSTSGFDGNIGSDGGALSGFNSSVVLGSFNNADSVTSQAKIDINNAYDSLMKLPNTVTGHAAAFGSGETIGPGVYYIGLAGSLAGTMTLDGQNNSDAIFVFKIAGAFSVAASAKMILTNGARRCNIFWIGGAGVATGAISIGASAVLKGTFLSHNGACSSGAGMFLAGRQLSTAGAVNTNSGIVYNNPVCVTSSSLSLVILAAVNDTVGLVNGTTGGTNVINVLANDSLNGNTITIAQVNLTTVATNANLTLNSDGSIDVSPNTPFGTQSLTYQICYKSDTTNCKSALVTLESVSCIQTPEPATSCDETATFNLATCSWSVQTSVSFIENTVAGLSNDASSSWGMSWGDYDNDGYDDLYVAEYNINKPSYLYHNNGDGTFTKNTSGIIIGDKGSSIVGTWGDYNNDGLLDLFVANNVGALNALYKNNGGGNFIKITTGEIANYSGYCHGASWVDYNGDGYLDLFVTDYMPTKFNLLYKNNKNGSFTKITSSELVQEAKYNIGATWADYDNDGDLDVFIPATNSQGNSMFKNDGNGAFEKMTTIGITTDSANSVGCSWGDYDNDMDLDLFVTNTSGQDNFLYRNNNDGTFTQITSGIVVKDGGHSSSSNWVDFDNDGDLDLYVCNDQSDANVMYTNDGSGSFTKSANPLSEDFGNSYSHAWSDYDNDGDIDIIIGNHSNENNVFFQNNLANCNSWSCIKLKGTNSNNNAIGAKVMVKATFNGSSIWQMKEISAQTGGGAGSQNSLKALFGLGNATSIDSIVVVWPAGYRQVLTNQSIDNCINIEEGTGIQVCGKVFHDANQDCIQGTGEKGIPGLLVKVTPGDRYTTTDESGNYQFFLELGTYTVSHKPTSSYSATCNANGFSLAISSGQTYCGKNFGVETSCISPDLSISLGTTALRREFQNDYSVVYRNLGAFDAYNVDIIITLDNEIIPISSSIAWSSSQVNASNSIYTWNIDTVKAFTTYHFSIVDSVDLNATMGSLLSVSATITNFSNDCDTNDNSYTDINPIVGAIDPNDLTVYPQGEGNEGFIEKNQDLKYKIRFQNVGTYYAQNVFITNELPQGIDMSSITDVTSSHKYLMSIEGRQITFRFSNILLPDSGRNEEASNGFITFNVLPKANVKQGELIPNKADIVFDFEAPLTTNKVLNTIKFNTGSENSLIIKPNPASNQTFISLEYNHYRFIDPTGITSVKVYDTMGTIIGNVNYEIVEQQIKLDCNLLSAGAYVVVVQDDETGLFTGRLIIQ
jgi:uncharacterized repeat protein (TIGR01451 family)